MRDKPAIPGDAKEIPNLGGGYFITPAGEVWSIKWGGPRKLKPFDGDGGPRVCLWRNGERYKPDVKTLLARTFGSDKPVMSDAALRASLVKEYGAGCDAVAWLDALGE